LALVAEWQGRAKGFLVGDRAPPRLSASGEDSGECATSELPIFRVVHDALSSLQIADRYSTRC